jgi:hypothetical protein
MSEYCALIPNATHIYIHIGFHFNPGTSWYILLSFNAIGSERFRPSVRLKKQWNKLHFPTIQLRRSCVILIWYESTKWTLFSFTYWNNKNYKTMNPLERNDLSYLVHTAWIPPIIVQMHRNTFTQQDINNNCKTRQGLFII